MDEPYLVVSLLSDDGTKLGFNAPTQSASLNLISQVFTDLKVLFCHSPYRVSASHLIGNLLSSRTSESRFCGAMLPPSLVEPLCFLSLEVELIRNFVELCCVVCKDLECFEADSFGKFIPLSRHVASALIKSPSNDDFVKDVTDTFRQKLLELRLCQEHGEDTHGITLEIQEIWRNARLLWDLSAAGVEEAALTEKWSSVGAPSRSSRKSLVKKDAKLVLATRMCLELGTRRKAIGKSPVSSLHLPTPQSTARDSTRQVSSPLHSPSHAIPVSARIPPSQAFNSLHPMELWTVAVLAEMFGVSALSEAVMTHMHCMICKDPCGDKYSQQQKLSCLSLPTSLRIEELMEDERECVMLAQRLFIHLHKFKIPRESPLVNHTQPHHTKRIKEQRMKISESPYVSPSGHLIGSSAGESPVVAGSVPLPTTFHGGNSHSKLDIDSAKKSNVESPSYFRMEKEHKHRHKHKQKPYRGYNRHQSSSNSSSDSIISSASSENMITRQHPSYRMDNYSSYEGRVNSPDKRSEDPSLPTYTLSPTRGQVDQKRLHKSSHISPPYLQENSYDTIPYVSQSSPTPHPYSPYDKLVSPWRHSAQVDISQSPQVPPTRPLSTHLEQRTDQNMTLSELHNSPEGSGSKRHHHSPKRVKNREIGSSRSSGKTRSSQHKRASSGGAISNASGSDGSTSKTSGRRARDRGRGRSPFSRKVEMYDENGHRMQRGMKQIQGKGLSQSLDSSAWRNKSIKNNRSLSKTVNTHQYDEGYAMDGHNTERRHRPRHRSSSTSRSRSRSLSRGYHSTGTMDSDGAVDRNSHSVAFGRSVTQSRRGMGTKSEVSASESASYALSSSALRVMNDEATQRKSIDPSEGRSRAISRLVQKRLQQESEKEKLALESALRVERLRAVELKAEMARLQRSGSPNALSQRPHSAPSSRLSPRATSPVKRSITTQSSRGDSESTMMQRSTSFDQNEARKRAATRVRERREQMIKLAQKQQELSALKEKEKWETRDKKIQAFLARQEPSSSPAHSPMAYWSSNMSTPTSESGQTPSPIKPTHHNQHHEPHPDDYQSRLKDKVGSRPIAPSATPSSDDYRFASADFSPAAYINWEADQPVNSFESMSPADVALNTASEVSSMIDEALGVTASPIHLTSYPQSSLPYSESNRQQTQSTDRNTFTSPVASKNRQSETMRGGVSPQSAGPYTPTRQLSDMFCIKVHRAHSLPDTLGGPNPYVVFDWGALGKASTHTVRNSRSPVFNSSLRFRSPASQGSSLGEALMKAPPLQVTLFSKNDSMSDECIGYCYIPDTSALQSDSEGLMRIDIKRDGDNKTLYGAIEFEIEIL